MEVHPNLLAQNQRSALDWLPKSAAELSRMGNLCGRASKESSNDAFARPGRILGSASAPSSNPRAPVPKIASTSGSVSGAGRTLGSSTGQEDTDARRAAAKAAEVFKSSDPYFPFPPAPFSSALAGSRLPPQEKERSNENQEKT